MYMHIIPKCYPLLKRDAHEVKKNAVFLDFQKSLLRTDFHPCDNRQHAGK